MTDDHDAADLEALAAHPRTDWDVLHWIAENYPSLRPTIAANPGTYQELVDALGTLGDPAIDEAIALRHRGRDVSSEAAASNPLAGMYDTATQTIPAYQPHPEAYEPYYSEIDYGAPAAAAAHAAPPAPPPPAAPPEPAPQEEPQRRAPLAVIATAILGVVAIGALVALLITFLGGEDSEPVAEPSPAEEDEAAPEEEDEEDAEEEPEEAAVPEEEEDEDADEGEQLVEARAAVSSLPEESACETGEDAGVVGAFLTAGAESGDFPEDEDTDLLENTFSELQSECSSTHAASVFTSVRGGDNFDGDSPETAQNVMDEVGTDWVDRAVGTRGASTASGFTAQGGNVVCEFDDGLVCTVFDTTPQLCDNGATYRMTLNRAGLDCDAELEPNGGEILPVDQSATDGFLVCTEMGDRLSCFNTVELFGFEVSNTGNYTY